MMSEIYARGPIACTIAVTQAFESYSGGIFNDTTHAMVSWSTDPWIVNFSCCALQVGINIQVAVGFMMQLSSVVAIATANFVGAVCMY